jgi:hypothetical protein
MKHLHIKRDFPNQAQSRLIKVNQGIFVNKFAAQSLVRQSSAKRSDGGIVPNFYQFSMNSTSRAPKPLGFPPRLVSIESSRGAFSNHGSCLAGMLMAGGFTRCSCAIDTRGWWWQVWLVDRGSQRPGASDEKIMQESHSREFKLTRYPAAPYGR